MRNILIFLLLTSTSCVLAQSLNDLDIKNGFRHFKFGSSPSQIKNIVKNSEQDLQNLNIVYIHLCWKRY
jgi:hypothetical protein